jgi:hypothetical protein
MRHVVIGGGIGGVCCVEELCRLVPQDVVTLVTASPALKVSARPARTPHTLAEALPWGGGWPLFHACPHGSCVTSALPGRCCLLALLQGVSGVVRLSKYVEEFKGEQR